MPQTVIYWIRYIWKYNCKIPFMKEIFNKITEMSPVPILRSILDLCDSKLSGGIAFLICKLKIALGSQAQTSRPYLLDVLQWSVNTALFLAFVGTEGFHSPPTPHWNGSLAFIYRQCHKSIIKKVKIKLQNWNLHVCTGRHTEKGTVSNCFVIISYVAYLEYLCRCTL